MSGYVFALGECFGCGQIFSFNPELVPSITPPGKSYEDRQPICRDCVRRVNPFRVQHGKAAIVVLPGAYDEAEHV